MDTRHTWNRVVLILLLLTSFSTFGQCDNDSITVVTVDSCDKVQMSPQKFTEFYLYKKNMDEIKAQLPEVENTLDSLRRVNRRIEVNLQAEIDSTNHQKSVVVESLDECTKLLAEVDIENSYLTHRVGELEKRQWKMFGYGTTIGVATVLILKILVQ